MEGEREELDADHNYGWLAAGLGAAAAWYLWSRNRSTTPGDVGAHAWLVPLTQARQEAEWTRRALHHSAEAKQEVMKS